MVSTGLAQVGAMAANAAAMARRAMFKWGLTGAAVDVASYRLAVHLGLAFVILGLIAWAVFLLGRRETDLLQAHNSINRVNACVR